MSAQYGLGFHKGLAAGEALGKADKASAVADAASASFGTGLLVGALGFVVAVFALVSVFALIDVVAKAIGEGLADV